jgi:hypothetical protein
MKRTGWALLTLLLLILLAACAVWVAEIKVPKGTLIQWQWIAVLFTFLALCIIAGILVNGRADGILISDRNRLSLERFQWVAWLVILLSGYFIEAIWNVAHGFNFPSMQQDLFVLLGIVSASPIVSNLIVDTKKRAPEGSSNLQRQAVQPLAMGDSPAQKGSMDVNKSVAEASWADLYLGEEAANRYVVDISRLQKLVVTIMLLVTYVSWLWKTLGTVPISSAGFSMPDAGDQFIWLVGISHAAYLGYKATPKTPS